MDIISLDQVDDAAIVKESDGRYKHKHRDVYIVGIAMAFDRYFSPYVFTFISVQLLTVGSWLSFFVPWDNVPGRMAPLVTVILALTNILLKTRDVVPDDAILTAMDVWSAAGLFQVHKR